MRKELCIKDGIRITYTSDNIAFEEVDTADSILLGNEGELIHSNFTEEKNEFFKEYLKQLYPAITTFRSLDSMDNA